MVDKPVHSEKEAKQLARAILKDRQKEMVKASGDDRWGCRTFAPDGRCRSTGLGARFNGTYFVTDTTHTFNDSGYVTRFNARREETGLLEGLQ